MSGLPDGTDLNNVTERGVWTMADAEFKAELAKAWDEGRESIAKDFMKPMDKYGMRESSTNPYREPPRA